jgi:Fe-S cluster assembly protein SufD
MTDWSALFDGAVDKLPGRGWVPGWRRAALDAFVAAGLPRAKAPAWRNTPLRALTRAPFALVDPGEAAADAPRVDGAARLLFVDGVLRAHDPLPDGVRVTALDQALAAGEARLPALLDAAPAAVNAPFDALNAAFLAGGALIEIAPGADVGALHLVHRSTGDAHSARHLRHLLTVGAGARATVVEHHACGPGLHSAVVDVAVGPNAALTHLALQAHGPEAVHLADLRVRVARDGRFSSVAVATGAAWSRAGIRVELAGPGAEASLTGLALGQEEQHLDHTVRVDHVAPHGTSRQRFRSILASRARSVFSSLLVVGPGAAGADATQDNRNLLLCDRAHADSEPQLEIHTDDVKASHGSATGKLDAEALFYLRARGVDARTARKLLTRAFAGELLDGVDHPGARALLEQAVTAWLEEAVR